MATAVKTPTEETIQSVLEIYERGRCVDAFRLAETFAPLREWSGVEGAALASRIAANIGAPRLASRLAVRAWRTDNAHPVAQLQFGFEFSGRRGPLALWLALRNWPQRRQPTPGQEAEWLALRGTLAADLRDFGAAEELLNRVESLGTKEPWAHLQKSHLLERQDRVEEALEIAKTATALHPHPYYRPGVQVQAHLLQLLDRDDEAAQLLKDADAFLQNGAVAAQWFSLLAENGRWQEAEAALERYVALSPLMEPRIKKWVTAQQARVSYHSGNRTQALRLAESLDDDFHKEFTRNLAAAPTEPERVQLDVTFVRQHFKTCAPATLAALGRYWEMPSEHLKLAEAMCYDGTPHWQQRQWAENNGWYVREFRVTHESAVALITRGIPFAISTVEATFAHMQAVAGFDRTRGALLLRDPGQPYIVEVPAEPFFKRYRPFGPHGMVFLPLDKRALLDGVELPDAEIRDEHYRFYVALTKHNRAEASAMLAQMEERFPGHEIVWEARLDLASHDGNNAELVRCLDKLLEMFPNNAGRLLRRLACMRDVSRDERIRFLEQACNVPDADPALFVELARALQGDARCLPDARRWLKRAFRFRPMDSTAIAVRADLYWQDSRLEEATELYQIAANLEGFREDLYQSWFAACRQTRRTNEAMTHLQDRFARFGRRSGQPALTLAWAWREMEQPARAREVLAEARRLRSDDSLLLLRSVVLFTRLGETAEADQLLESAKGKVRANDWLRTAAELAENRLDASTALQNAREILKLEPLALDAHGGVARSLARLEGTNAALAHLKAVCAEFPHHYGLQRMRVEWSRNAGPAAVEAAARELLRIDGADAWARRELAVALANLNRNEEALQEASEAARAEPRNTFSFSVLGHVHTRLQQLPEARAQFRRAVELSVDNSDAIHSLMELVRTDKERREELEFIERQLIRQVVNGDGLLAFLDTARPLVEPERLLKSLRLAHSERPDLWHAWSALASQLGHLGKLQEARDLARAATEKFPHLPRVWLDLAMVHQWRDEPDEEISAAEHAFEINPAWNSSTLALTGVLERRGRLDDAGRVYERALQHSAYDPQLHACSAHLLWRQRRKEDAFAAVERALRLEPGFSWAWGLLTEWATEDGQPQRAAGFSRALTRERPGEMRVWIMLARVLNDPAHMPERIAAVEKALELDVKSTEAWDLKAELLANAERFEEAIRACEEGSSVCTSDTYILGGRRAWIEAQRRQFPEAVRLMRLVLAENVSYVWGWNQLAQWLLEQGATADAVIALEQLLRLRPRDPWVYRQLGFLRLKQEDRAAAQKAFATALELAPADSYAAQNIFDLQLQAGDLKGAATTLRVMEMHQPGVRTLAAGIFLHVRTKQRSAAIEAFGKLCASPDPDPWPVDAVANAFKDTGQTWAALKILRHALKRPSCNPQVAAAAIRLLFAERKNYAALRLFMNLKSGEIQQRAAAPLVYGLAEQKCTWLFRRLLRHRREVLARDDAAWGQVGYALSHFKRMKAVADWLADWPTRPNVQPWMLFNLCMALRHLGRFTEANAIAQYVLDKWGHREGSADLRLFLAVEEAIAGKVSAAAAHLQHVAVRDNVAYDVELLAIAKALVEFQQSPAANRSQSFRAARRQLEKHFSAWRMLRVMKDVRRTFRRSGDVFVRQGGGWRARLWFSWKLNWQWLLLPLAPIALAVAVQPPVLLAILFWRLTRNRRQ